MQLLDCVRDRDEWDNIVRATDPHFSSAFYRAFGNGKLFVLKQDDTTFSQPFMRQEGSWVGNAYNFGGPLGPSTGLDRFIDAFDGWKDANSLSERCTVSPFIDQYVLKYRKNQQVKPVIYVDLTEPLNFRQTTEHSIKKAEKAGVKTELVPISVQNAAIFEGIYAVAADRLNMRPHWRYSQGFFYRVLRELGDIRSSLFITKVGDKIESGCLLIYDTDICYYHWAARLASEDVCSDHMQVATVINWAKAAGMKMLVLGGGLKVGDGLYTFKSGFSDKRIDCNSFTVTDIGW